MSEKTQNLTRERRHKRAPILCTFLSFFFLLHHPSPGGFTMCPTPVWIWLFEQKEHSLQKLHRELRYMEPGYITNQATNIDIHPMDFWTGDTDPSLIEFFAPDTDTDFKIANTALDPEDPVDDPFTWVRAMKDSQDFTPHEMHHQLYKAFSKYLRKSPGGNKTPIFWDLVS